MLIAKLFLLSSLFFNYSFRTPTYIDKNIYDYEYRLGCEGVINNHDNISYLLLGLYEREEGIKGFGHNVEFELKDNIKIEDNQHPCFYSFSSYYRKVNDFSLQSFDISVRTTKHVRLGISVAGDWRYNGELMFYGAYVNGWLKAVIRTDMDTFIKDFRLKKELKVKGNIYLEPQLIYKSINSNKDYQGNLLLKYKFKIKE